MERLQLKGKTHAELVKMLEEMLFQKSFAAKLDQAIKKREAEAKQREFLLRKAAERWGGEVRVVLHGVWKR